LTGQLVLAALLLGFSLLFWIDDARMHRRHDRAVKAHAEAIEAERAAWRAAHSELVARGCPPPPTPLSMTTITLRGGLFS
jgi:hypothetical protein